MCMPQWIALIVLWGSLGVPEAKRIKPPSMAASMLDAMQDVSGSTPAVEEVLVAKAVRDSKPRDDDYWRETGALERCKRARIGRFIKQVVGIPVGVVVGGPAMFLSGAAGFSVLMFMDVSIAAGGPLGVPGYGRLDHVCWFHSCGCTHVAGPGPEYCQLWGRAPARCSGGKRAPSSMLLQG